MKVEELEKNIEKSRNKVFESELYKRASSGTLSLELYKGYLKETYHYVKHASRFYAAAAARLPEDWESVRSKLMQYAVEENGHESYLINDLSILGEDPEKIRRSQPLVEADALVGFHYYIASFGNPMAIWGNIYAIEGLSSVAPDIVRKLMSSLNLKENSFSFLISHGEPNLVHFEGAKQIVENVIQSDSDKEAVIFCAKAALELHAFMFKGVYEHYNNPRDT